MAQAAPVPHDEAERLRQLRALALLDTAPEAIFDTLARLASAVCQTPMALVSLVDEHRQWFKANIGLAGVQQTPRDLAFCAHAILESGCMEVPDALLDARFADNALVTGEPRLRFYAGAPIAAPGGQRIGTLCVLDRQPRRLSVEQRQQLAELAAAASQALALRDQTLTLALEARSRLEAELSGHVEALNSVLDLLPAGVSVWSRDLRNEYANHIHEVWSGRSCTQLLGGTLAEVFGTGLADQIQAQLALVFDGQRGSALARAGTGVESQVLSLQLMPRLAALGRVDGMVVLAQDVTAEHQAAQLSERLSAVVNHSSDAIISLDRTGLIQLWNPAASRLFGYSSAQAIGQPIRLIHAPAQPNRVEPILEWLSGLADAELTYEGVLRHREGSALQVQVSLAPMRAGDGRTNGASLVLREVGSLRLAQDALGQSERRFRTLAESSPLGVFETDSKGQCTYVNERWQEIFGLSLPQSLGDGWSQTLHPDDRDEVTTAWQRATTLGSEFEMAFRVRRPDGQQRYVRSRARPQHLREGATEGFVGALVDVTERHEAEQRLRASEAFLDRTGRIARVGGWEVDFRQPGIVWSDETCRIHEMPPGHKPTLAEGISYYAREAQPVVEAAVRRAAETGAPFDLQLPFITARGRRIWVRTAGEVEFEGGRPARLIGALQDVTEWRERQEELAQEQALRLQLERRSDELKRLLTERSEMLDVLAHEVRQPLNNASAALQSAAQALSGMSDPRASARLTRAQTVLSHVLARIDNTLATAALLAGTEPITPQDTDIDTLLAVAIADMPLPQRQRIRVVRATLTRTAAMDMSLLRLAVRNLLANALKYANPESVVTVRVSELEDPLALVIDVIDAGPGIEAEFVPHLFERGSRGGQSRLKPGHGLGLNIVQRVMELHRGTATLAANGPTGATLRLTIPQLDSP